MRKVIATGLAAWACHLVNGDPSELSDADFAELQDWLAYHGVLDDECVGAKDAGFGRLDMPGGLRGDLQEYTFLVDKADWRARVAG